MVTGLSQWMRGVALGVTVAMGVGTHTLAQAGAPEGMAGLGTQWDFRGFMDARAGIRTRDDPNSDNVPLAETRWQYGINARSDRLILTAVADFVADIADDDHAIDLETGASVIDLREANVFLRAAPWLDVKLGRQILSWGTGDMLFVNDLFPKDWVALLIGRDETYLKAPSDALKLGFFSGIVDLDVVYTPRFDADHFPDGRRLSFYNPLTGSLAGEDAVLDTDRPDRWFRDDEWAWRLYRVLGSCEFALYGYQGYWKSPAGMDPVEGQTTFPRLAVYGASARQSLWGGIGNIEIGYYDSMDDRTGADPFVRNSEFRILAGFQKEVADDLTLGVQYYVERMMDYASYRASLPLGTPEADEDHHILTLRLTKRALRQDLLLSLFVFYSPSDRDAYLRPMVEYRITDDWSVTAGANQIIAVEQHTYFGQFERNSNAYIGSRLRF